MKLFIKLLPTESPGNSVVLTASIRDLKKGRPDFRINVGGGVIQDFFQNNPHISQEITEQNADRIITARFPFTGNRCTHYQYSYLTSITQQLGITVNHGDRRPELFLTEEEERRKPVVSRPYWILNAAYRTNISAKFWGHSNFHRLAELLKEKTTIVQIGSRKNDTVNSHVPGTIDLRGQTNLRELMLLIRNSQGVITPCSLPMHIAAAFRRPCVVIAGGRESMNWTSYDDHQFIHTIGQLFCCREYGCYKRRIIPRFDGNKFDESLCFSPCVVGNEIIPECMTRISPERVAEAVKSYMKPRYASRIFAPVWAGKQYPAEKNALHRLCNEIITPPISSDYNIFIVPHHKYNLTSSVLRPVFSRIAGKREVKRVIVLGPSHKKNLGTKIAVTDVRFAETPIGRLNLDVDSAKKWIGTTGFVHDNSVHRAEWSTQTLYPLILAAAPSAMVFPVLIGKPDRETERIAAEMIRGMMDENTVLLVSSDFTHYGEEFHSPPFGWNTLETIRIADRTAIDAFQSGNPEQFAADTEQKTICGKRAIRIIMSAVPVSPQNSELLEYATSYETNRNIKKIVAYAAIGVKYDT